jgi:hypothetical protein
MIIQIDGWFAGGKVVLWSLLDGHKDIFVNPVHDYSYSSLLDKKNNEEWIDKQHTTFLRKTFASSEYYKFEKLFLEQKLGITYSTDITEYIPYTTNFYEFDKQFYSTLNGMKSWSIESIAETLYETYYKQHTNNFSNYPKYYASMSNPWKYKHYCNIPEIFPNMKSITVKRGLKNIIATRTNRTQREDDLNSFQAYCTPFEVILERKEVEWILNFFHTNEELQKKYPKQFLVIDFDDLVRSTQDCMKKVAHFLEIDYDEILAIPTRDGKLLEYNGLSFIGQENDDYKRLLTQEEINILDTMELNFIQEHSV